MNDLSSLALIRGMPPAWRQDVRRRIGEFVVHPASNELASARGTVRVRPRLMDVLLRLAAEPGVVIPRNRLLEEVWPRRMVSDEVLSRTIAELRTVLGDDPRHPSYIETIPTVGYRLVATTGDDVAATDAIAAKPLAGAIATSPAEAITQAHNAGDAPLAPTAPVAAPRRAQQPRTRMAVALAALAIVAIALLAYRYESAGNAQSLAVRIANATPFTSDPGLEMEPRFAPDGKRIAYSSSSEFTSPAHIVVLDLGASAAQRTLADADAVVSYRSPVFIAGSSTLAYARCTPKGCRIVRHDLEQGDEQVLVGDDHAPMPNFDVSADGRWLVYANMRRPQFPSGLALVDLATGATRDLSLPDAGAGDDAMPRFSPDGSRIAYFRSAGGMQALWTMDRDGRHAEMASNARGAVFGAAWRDARHVLVAADWFGFRALNDVDLATHTATFAGARGARFPDIAPSGEIIYENAQFRADLWAFDAVHDTLGAAPVWPSTRFTMNPEFSPDGSRVVFVSNREGAEALFVATGDGAPVRLKLPERYRYVNAHWSHDGRALYSMRLDADPPHAQSVVRIDATTGATEILGALGADVDEIFADRTGRYLYYAVGTGQTMRLMRAPLADLDAQERLPFPPVSNFMVDGTRIAFAQPQIRGLTSCNLADLACEALPLPISESTMGAWTLGAGSVWFLDTSAMPATLARYDLAAGRVTLRSASSPMAYGRTIAVSPDGGKVLLARQAPTLIDLMIAR